MSHKHAIVLSSDSDDFDPPAKKQKREKLTLRKTGMENVKKSKEKKTVKDEPSTSHAELPRIKKEITINAEKPQPEPVESTSGNTIGKDKKKKKKTKEKPQEKPKEKKAVETGDKSKEKKEARTKTVTKHVIPQKISDYIRESYAIGRHLHRLIGALQLMLESDCPSPEHSDDYHDMCEVCDQTLELQNEVNHIQTWVDHLLQAARDARKEKEGF